MSAGPETIYKVAKALEELNEHSVFVGGATLPFYLKKAQKSDVRPTEDVDVVLNIIPKVHFHKREDILRAKGFKNVFGNRTPLCRWRLGDILVDFVPPESDESGPSNKWYKLGIKNTQLIQIKDIEIKILNSLFFIATKVEAYLGRGNNDPIYSHDMEDIIAVLESMGEKKVQDEISMTDKVLLGFLKDFFEKIKVEAEFISAVQGYCSSLPDQDKSVTHVFGLIEQLTINP